MPAITFRPKDDGSYDRLEALAKRNGRTLAVEMRAAVDTYLLLHDLVGVRELAIERRRSGMAPEEIERRIKDEFGRIFLAAISTDAESLFENAAGVDYPRNRIGTIVTPYERLLDWVV